MTKENATTTLTLTAINAIGSAIQSAALGHCHIHFHSFPLNTRLREDAEEMLGKFLSASALRAFVRRSFPHAEADWIARRTASLSGVDVDWRLQGPLSFLADAVCTMQFKTLVGDLAFAQAWSTLRTGFSDADGAAHPAMNVNLTKTFMAEMGELWDFFPAGTFKQRR